MIPFEVRERFFTTTRHRLVAAFLASLFIHTVLYVGWRIGDSMGLWDHQATWLLHWNKVKKVLLVPVPPPPPVAAQPPPKEIPLTFIEVDPTVAVAEEPKDAKYYGALNAQATNPDAQVETAVPKSDGKQEQVPRMADVPKPNPFPLQPSLPPPEPAPPKPADPPPTTPPAEPKVGDMAEAKPKMTPEAVKPETPDKALLKPEPRPRTVEEARRRRMDIMGQTMKEDGGTKRRGTLAFDVKATEFGAYDAALIAAVQKRWYDLLDSSPFAQRSGKVVLNFRLTYDGRVTDMMVNGNEVGEILGLLCQRAVLDPAPFAAWPSDMRRRIGANYRDVTFTFYYN